MRRSLSANSMAMGPLEISAGGSCARRTAAGRGVETTIAVAGEGGVFLADRYAAAHKHTPRQHAARGRPSPYPAALSAGQLRRKAIQQPLEPHLEALYARRPPGCHEGREQRKLPALEQVPDVRVLEG